MCTHIYTFTYTAHTHSLYTHVHTHIVHTHTLHTHCKHTYIAHTHTLKETKGVERRRGRRWAGTVTQWRALAQFVQFPVSKSINQLINQTKTVSQKLQSQNACDFNGLWTGTGVLTLSDDCQVTHLLSWSQGQRHPVGQQCISPGHRQVAPKLGIALATRVLLGHSAEAGVHLSKTHRA